MNTRYYPTLHLDTNQSKETTSLFLVLHFIITMTSSVLSISYVKWMWNGPQKGLGMKFSDTPLVDNHGFFVGLMLFFFYRISFPKCQFSTRKQNKGEVPLQIHAKKQS